MNFTKPLIPLVPENVKYIVIHHAEWDNASELDIHNEHISRGWSGGGYNEYIRKDGSVHIMRGDNVGAHCQGYNSKSYGICLEGNYQTTSDVPKAQWNALVERVKYNSKRFNAEIVPHSKLVKTECPGKLFPMMKLISDLTRKEEVKLNIKEAVQILVDEKIINSPEHWESATKIVKFLDILIINVAEYIRRVKNGN